MPAILLVEDNELTRDRLSRLMERKGYTIAIAVNGGRAEAVNMAATTPYDFIPIDMSLPVMDGNERKAREADGDNYDTKPVDLPRLLAKMGALLKV